MGATMNLRWRGWDRLRRFAAVLGGLLAGLAVAGAAAPTPVAKAGRSFQVIDMPGLICGDGSAFRIFFAPAPLPSNRVVLWLPGGSSTLIALDGTLSTPINSLAELRNRLAAPLAPASSDSGDNLFTDHPANAAFIAAAHWAIVPYCTQDFHAGNLSTPITYDFIDQTAFVDDLRDKIAQVCRNKQDPIIVAQDEFPSLTFTFSGPCNSKSLPDQITVDSVRIDITHNGAHNLDQALQRLQLLLFAQGVNLASVDFLFAGSSAGGFGTWYNAWRVGDVLFGQGGTRLTMVPMSGSPTTRLWEEAVGQLRENATELADLQHRLDWYQTALPCAVSGGAYLVDPAARCLDTPELTGHYLARYPGLDLRIVPVINKEDNLGVLGFAGDDPSAPGFGARLLQFCRTVHGYGAEANQVESVHPWLGWLWWRLGPAGMAHRVHGFKQAAQLVPMAQPDGGPGVPAGDGLHGVLAFINSVANRDLAATAGGHIEHRLALIDAYLNRASGLIPYPDFSGDWQALGLSPALCNVSAAQFRDGFEGAPLLP